MILAYMPCCRNPSNPRARIYKHFKYGKHKTKDKAVELERRQNAKPRLVMAKAGLAARQLLSESIIAVGASFEDTSAATNKGKGKGKRKGEGKNAKAGRDQQFMHFQCKTSLLIGLLTITNSNRQVSEEEQTRKELKKDMDAINALVSSIRAASMGFEFCAAQCRVVEAAERWHGEDQKPRGKHRNHASSVGSNLPKLITNVHPINLHQSSLKATANTQGRQMKWASTSPNTKSISRS